METGNDFLRAQINNGIMQHQSLLNTLRDHVEQADDPAFRELCAQHIPNMERHQSMIEAYGDTIGTHGGGAVKNAIGAVLGVEIMDYRETYGYEVRDAKWRQQFTGKTAAAPLKLDADIKNISGATLSSRHITDGVKRLLATHAITLAKQS